MAPQASAIQRPRDHIPADSHRPATAPSRRSNTSNAPPRVGPRGTLTRPPRKHFLRAVPISTACNIGSRVRGRSSTTVNAQYRGTSGTLAWWLFHTGSASRCHCALSSPARTILQCSRKNEWSPRVIQQSPCKSRHLPDLPSCSLRMTIGGSFGISVSATLTRFIGRVRMTIGIVCHWLSTGGGIR